MKYRLVNKNVIPRPFKGRVLRYNVPVVIEAELTKAELDSLKAYGVVYEKIAPAVKNLKKKDVPIEAKPKKANAHKTKKETDDKVGGKDQVESGKN